MVLNSVYKPSALLQNPTLSTTAVARTSCEFEVHSRTEKIQIPIFRSRHDKKAPSVALVELALDFESVRVKLMRKTYSSV